MGQLSGGQEVGRLSEGSRIESGNWSRASFGLLDSDASGAGGAGGLLAISPYSGVPCTALDVTRQMYSVIDVGGLVNDIFHFLTLVTEFKSRRTNTLMQKNSRLKKRILLGRNLNRFDAVAIGWAEDQRLLKVSTLPFEELSNPLEWRKPQFPAVFGEPTHAVVG